MYKNPDFIGMTTLSEIVYLSMQSAYTRFCRRTPANAGTPACDLHRRVFGDRLLPRNNRRDDSSKRFLSSRDSGGIFLQGF